MALDLKDIRCKVDPVTHAFLCGEAMGKGVDVCDVIRDVLDSWATVRRSAHIETQRYLQAQGLAGAEQGTPGQAGKTLKW